MSALGRRETRLTRPQPPNVTEKLARTEVPSMSGQRAFRKACDRFGLVARVIAWSVRARGLSSSLWSSARRHRQVIAQVT